MPFGAGSNGGARRKSRGEGGMMPDLSLRLLQFQRPPPSCPALSTIATVSKLPSITRRGYPGRALGQGRHRDNRTCKETRTAWKPRDSGRLESEEERETHVVAGFSRERDNRRPSRRREPRNRRPRSHRRSTAALPYHPRPDKPTLSAHRHQQSFLPRWSAKITTQCRKVAEKKSPSRKPTDTP